MRYSGLVRSIAGRYSSRGFTFDDICQVGYLGLIQAVDRYDPTREIPLQAYAYRMIEGEILHLFRDHGWSVRVPRTLQELSRRLRLIEQDVVQREGRHAGIDELAELAGEPVELVEEALAASTAYAAVSLDEPMRDEDGSLSERTIPVDDPGFSRIVDNDALRDAIQRLPVRQRDILHLRFEHELTQKQIAERVGISQMHVSRLIGDALARLEATMSDAFVAA
jgi:RNA polymerase sigma-B factor